MSDLQITFGLEEEIDRVKYTLSRLDWYKENGYSVDLPDGLDMSSSDEEISHKISQEYDLEKYKEAASTLGDLWTEFAPHLLEIKESGVLNIAPSYTAILTLYGTGGSYDSSRNEVILKIKNRPLDDIFGTLLHEIVHISIQPFIVKYKVPHWYKERLVDLIGQKYFQDKRKIQNIKTDVQVVNTSFEKYFPDIERIVESFSGL